MSETKQGLAHRLYSGQLSYDFIGRRRVWFLISAVVLVVSILTLAFRGLTLGIEFSGGTDFQAPMTVQSDTVEQVRSEVAAIDIADLEPQVFALGENAIRVQTRALTPDETTTMRAAIAEITGASTDDVTYNAIGPSWGQRISQQAGIALIVFLVLVSLLIWAWFRDWRMSVSALVALAHDLTVTVGVYALVGFTVTPSTLIGVLTILGYSLYDTVVVFDKVKENVRGIEQSAQTYSQASNLAVNQVLIRSLNTTIIGVLPVAGLLVAGTVLGGGPLGDLGLALFVGMVAGAYSSIFIATPVLAMMKERDPKQVAHRATLARRQARAKAKAESRRAHAE
ncbi:MAG: protein translocase subunit SecF [Arachnia sp.]